MTRKSRRYVIPGLLILVPALLRKQFAKRVWVAAVVSGVLLGVTPAAWSAPLRVLRQSDFEQDAEGWTSEGGSIFSHRLSVAGDPSSRGAPRSRNGHVESVGHTSRERAFTSPQSFVGDWTAAYRGKLTYFHRSATGNPIIPFIFLSTSRLSLVYIDVDHPVPSREWTRVEVPLHERSWRSLGRELTRNEFLCALAEITTFSIGELEGGIGTAWSLDQVTLSARTSAGHAAADRRVRFFPRRLDFGPVLACEEQAEALLVWNPLPRPIRVNFRERATPQNGFAWALSPPDPDFCGVIPPHEEIGIVVSFAPPAAGRYEDAIPFEFERNPFRAPGEMFTVNYSLKGEGVASLEGEGVAGAVGSSAPGVRGGETTLLEPPLFLPPNPSLNPPFTSVTSTTVLQQGSTYTLVVTGTVTRTFQNLGSLFDAFYCYDETVDGVSQGRCTSNGQQFYGSLVRVSLGGVWSELPLEALGGPNTFPPYNPNHRYEVTFTAPATGNLTLRENGFIIEAASGGYTVEIHGRDGVGPMCPS